MNNNGSGAAPTRRDNIKRRLSSVPEARAGDVDFDSVQERKRHRSRRVVGSVVDSSSDSSESDTPGGTGSSLQSSLQTDTLTENIKSSPQVASGSACSNIEGTIYSAAPESESSSVGKKFTHQVNDYILADIGKSGPGSRDSWCPGFGVYTPASEGAVYSIAKKPCESTVVQSRYSTPSEAAPKISWVRQAGGESAAAGPVFTKSVFVVKKAESGVVGNTSGSDSDKKKDSSSVVPVSEQKPTTLHISPSPVGDVVAAKPRVCTIDIGKSKNIAKDSKRTHTEAVVVEPDNLVWEDVDDGSAIGLDAKLLSKQAKLRRM